MFRERLVRFLPTHSVPQGRWNIEAVPRVSDQELVDLSLNLDFLPGDDICRVRELYEQAAKKQPLSWVEPPDAVEESTQQSSESSFTASPGSDSTGARITISTQIISQSPRLDGLYPASRSEEHTSELQSLMRISYAVFCLKKKKNRIHIHNSTANEH